MILPGYLFPQRLALRLALFAGVRPTFFLFIRHFIFSSLLVLYQVEPQVSCVI
jgi:hypothetical protein